MSWNKNTINLSSIDNTIEILESLNIPYKLNILVVVAGRGINDEIWKKNRKGIQELENKLYQIRKLEWKDIVYIDQMQKTYDCDSHDYLVTLRFLKGKEPKNLPVEIYIDEKEYNNITEKKKK